MKLIRLSMAAIALLGAGCSTPTGGGTASLPTPGPDLVTGRDIGRGEATSGGISSLDPGDNAADWSVYDAQRYEAQR
ncbi:MAG TPA: hypothetical protein VHY22_14500 [Chthoniobacteraceae bacterium]|nr:hypothetical protein [Chthoniobacteraceae bacterium]